MTEFLIHSTNTTVNYIIPIKVSYSQLTNLS